MKKYFLKNKEVHLGEKISYHDRYKDSSLIIFDGILNEKALNFLVSIGLIKEEDSLSGEDVLNSIMERNNVSSGSLYCTLSTLSKINPHFVTQVLLKEISILMEKKYNGDYKKQKLLYGVNAADYSVFPFTPANGIMWNNFASFRSEDDAKEALNLIFSNEIKDTEC